MRAVIARDNGFPAWYAPCVEGAYENEAICWYWVSSDPDAVPEPAGIIGTPVWAENAEKLINRNSPASD